MRNALSALNSWLKTNKIEISDEMIESIVIGNNVTNVVLLFTSDGELASFAMRMFPNASVTKLDNEKEVIYAIKFTHKKQGITAVLKVVLNLPQRVAQTFSDERNDNIRASK